MVEIIKTEKTGRNEPCHCGSGKKYKKCCMPKSEVEQRINQQGMWAIFRSLIKKNEGQEIKISLTDLQMIPANEGIIVDFNQETAIFTLKVVGIKQQSILTPNKRIIG
jgi:hypothetical protein